MQKKSRPKIGDKDRKLLWAKSGSRCAICKKFLVNTEDQDGRGVIVGIECHIVGHSMNGPRGKSDLDISRRYKYENLILLCMEHSKTIDERVDVWTVDKLNSVKKEHENKVVNLVNDAVTVSPKIKLIEFTGKWRGGPMGHFAKFTIRNFGIGEAIDLTCWIEGWNFHADMANSHSFLEDKQVVEYELRLDGIFSRNVPFLKFYAKYKNLDGVFVLYECELRQILINEAFYDIKKSSKEEYQLTDKSYFDVVLPTPYTGGFHESEFLVNDKKFRVKVSDTLLAIWGIETNDIHFCLTEIAKSNLKVMKGFGVYQDKDYSTYSYDGEVLTLKETLSLIEKGLL